MLDATLRNLTETPRAAAMARLGGSGDGAVTVAAFALGVAAAGAVAFGHFPAGLVLLLAGRVAALLRPESNPVGRTLDFIAYASLAFAFALADPTRSLAALFVMLALLAAGMTVPAAGSPRSARAVIASLAESTEIAVAFALACLLPDLFSIVAYVLGLACIVSAGARIADAALGQP